MTAVPVPTPPRLTPDARRVLRALDRHGTFLGALDALAAEAEVPATRAALGVDALVMRGLARREQHAHRVLVSLTPRGRVFARMAR